MKIILVSNFRRNDINLKPKFLFDWCFIFIFLNFFLLNFYFFFILLYNTVLVLPYISMNPPRVYMCSQSWTPLPPPSPYHPSVISQCTNLKHSVSCIEPRLAIRFLYDNKRGEKLSSSFYYRLYTNRKIRIIKA